eukprot:138971_1
MIGLALLVVQLIFDISTAISVCDDVDIFFLIDKESLVDNYEGVANILEGIIQDGSSEDAAYSLMLYGDGLSDYQLALQLDLVDTFNTYRYNKSTTILQRLQDLYDDITLPNQPSNQPLHDISLANAFDAATKQQQPTRKYYKRKRLERKGYEQHSIGAADDENRYFIFDHSNKLLDTSDTADGEICELFNYIGNHNDESIHFIMGQEFN